MLQRQRKRIGLYQACLEMAERGVAEDQEGVVQGQGVPDQDEKPAIIINERRSNKVRATGIL